MGLKRFYERSVGKRYHAMSSIFKYAATLVGGQSHKAQQSGPGSTRVGTDPQIDQPNPRKGCCGDRRGVWWGLKLYGGGGHSVLLDGRDLRRSEGERPIISEKTLGATITFASEINGEDSGNRTQPIVFNAMSSTSCASGNIKAASLHTTRKDVIINQMGKLGWISSSRNSFNPSVVDLFEYEANALDGSAEGEYTRVGNESICLFFPGRCETQVYPPRPNKRMGKPGWHSYLPLH